MCLWRSASPEHLPILVGASVIEARELSMCSRQETASGWELQTLPPLWVIFTSLLMSSETQRVFISKTSSWSIFLFCCLCFWCHIKESAVRPKVTVSSPVSKWDRRCLVSGPVSSHREGGPLFILTSTRTCPDEPSGPSVRRSCPWEAAVPTLHLGMLLSQGAGTGHSELQVQGRQVSGPRAVGECGWEGRGLRALCGH